MNKVSAYGKLLRIPGLGALATPTVIGALSVGVFELESLILLFFIGGFAAVYGFILNDYADVELDGLVPELQQKPLVSGDINRKTAVAISVFLIMLTFLIIFILWRGEELTDTKFWGIFSIFLAGILGSIYNLYGKKIVGSDFLVAISMGLVFLFGAMSVGIPTPITWIIFWLTFNQTLHMNAVEGGIKDIDHDFKMGVVNIASKAGVIVRGNALVIPSGFKAFGMGIRLISAVLLFTPFFVFNYSYEIWQIILLGIFTFLVLFFSMQLVMLKEWDRSKIRRYIGLQSFLRYSLVPIMLISIIGMIPSVILIILPIAWYIVFTPLLGETLFQPRM
jgi:4-hydroxybenzoate polyprenyltransferase